MAKASSVERTGSSEADDVRRVRVWFGRRLIFDYLADPDLAQRYEDAMRRRFAGVRITNEPVATSRDQARA